MADIIVGLVIVIVLGLVIRYIVRAKKRGEKCIGCPHSKSCSKHSCGVDNEC